MKIYIVHACGRRVECQAKIEMTKEVKTTIARSRKERPMMQLVYFDGQWRRLYATKKVGGKNEMYIKVDGERLPVEVKIERKRREKVTIDDRDNLPALTPEEIKEREVYHALRDYLLKTRG